MFLGCGELAGPAFGAPAAGAPACHFGAVLFLGLGGPRGPAKASSMKPRGAKNFPYDGVE